MFLNQIQLHPVIFPSYFFLNWSFFQLLRNKKSLVHPTCDTRLANSVTLHFIVPTKTRTNRRVSVALTGLPPPPHPPVLKLSLASVSTHFLSKVKFLSWSVISPQPLPVTKIILQKGSYSAACEGWTLAVTNLQDQQAFFRELNLRLWY